MDPSRQAGSTAPLARERLLGILAALEDGLVERRPVVRLALLAALAGEHTLLVGPPGTAKSQLARRLHLAFAEGRYFERLLTRFTVPEELFGPLSISALEEDRYERRTAGFLPQATIAFIDEVFKANSAILNALLTLLNEREFDNGPRREACPLISAIGATNAVPDDEVGEAFFDRFLVRLPVAPVSAAAFRTLLEVGERPPVPVPGALDRADREAVARAAGEVRLPDEVAALLAEARAHLAADGLYVSDRRWVKLAALLAVAAATEGRAEASIWDLWLLPWCTAPDGPRQAAVAAWLAARLGVREALSPPRLTRVVEAFEAQLEAERAANDLDYDEQGRLRLGADLAAEIGDAKGGAAAPRLAYARTRRYGDAHVAARLRQVDDLVRRVDAYVAELSARRDDLARHLARAVWMDEEFARRADESLRATVDAVRALRARARRARDGFEALPRLAGDPGTVPAPVEHEPLET
ncbi:MAG TPA: AAA family ATPase [Anaeromyxobacter sp.]|nr:AAA family ATPase [Anaeromyxobacter sp.]